MISVILKMTFCLYIYGWYDGNEIWNIFLTFHMENICRIICVSLYPDTVSRYEWPVYI